MGGGFLFWISSGLVGLCQGPAIAALTVGGAPVVGFLIAMIAGMAVYEIHDRMTLKSDNAGSALINEPK
ncbi:MAG: DUF6691 family protein [Pseudomonadota bacterium]